MIPKRMATDFRRNLVTSNVVIVSLNGGRRKVVTQKSWSLDRLRTRLLPIINADAIVDSDGE